MDASINDSVEAVFPTEDLSHDADIVAKLEEFNKTALNYPGESGKRTSGVLFRGELDCLKALQSTLEREFFRDSSRLPTHLKRTSVSGNDLKEAEVFFYNGFLKNGGRVIAETICEQFVHMVSTDIIDKLNPQNVNKAARDEVPALSKGLFSPADADVFTWLSYMRHYRHPTRFVDFTRDIRFAIYFCLEQSKFHPNSEFFYIYRFPCVYFGPDADQKCNENKSPFSPTTPRINMHRALGLEMQLPCVAETPHPDDKNYHTRRQSWGWDRPYFQNPRLWHQKGMFVYPFDYPDTELTADGPSWLIQNLSSAKDSSDRFNLCGEKTMLPAKRIKIPISAKPKLEEFLRTSPKLTEATVYMDFEKVDLFK